MWGSPPPLEKACVVCISEDQASHYRALFGREARVCYNGVDGEEFYRPMNVPRSDRFLFLARFSSIKGPDLAIEACLKAGVGLDLVGDTSITNEPELLKRCQSMADGKQIRMVGPSTRSRCVWWFSQAVALVHYCPIYREPFGLAPVEAMLCGCPVVAFRYGAVKETIKDGETGFVVGSMDEAVQKIKYLSQPNPFGPIMRSNCRQWALENFSVQRMVDRYESLCEEAIQTGGW